MVDDLRNNYYDVVLIRNARKQIVEKSQVIDRIDNLEYAYEVAGVLGIDKENVKREIDKKIMVDVSVLIGKDYGILTRNIDK